MHVVKKQHFVPRFYLRHFTNTDGKLHAFNRETKELFLAAPENVCAQNNLYEVRMKKAGSDGGGPSALANTIEVQLSGLEGRLAPLYEQLLSCCSSRVFKGEEYERGRHAACMLAANLIVRHPALLAADRAKNEEFAEEFLTEDKLSDQEQQILEQLGLKKDATAVAEIAIMQTLLLSGNSATPFFRIFDAFADKAMTIFEAPVGAWFITTSMPLGFEGIEEDAYDFETAYLPLSSKYAAFFTSRGGGIPFREATLKEVTQCNSALVADSAIWKTALSCAKGPLELAIRDSFDEAGTD